MSDSVETYKILKVYKVWDTGNTIVPEPMEIYLVEGDIVVSRYKKDGELTFTSEEWEAINNFIREELEANAETNS